MYDFNARTYDQQIGRFLQVDPDIEKGEQETQSPYHFAKNNPVRYNDPDGKCPTCPPSNWEMQATQDGKLGKGLVQSGKETATGFFNMVAHPINTLKGIGNAIMHPIETVEKIVEGVKSEFKADPTIASGKLLGDVLQVALGGEIIKSASKATVAAEGGNVGKTAGQLGKEGMVGAGLEQNTTRIPSLSGTANYRVPDGLTNTTLSEVKNVKTLSMTNQLNDYMQYSKQNGLGFDLYVRPTTQLSGPLQQQVVNGNINLQLLPK